MLPNVQKKFQSLWMTKVVVKLEIGKKKKVKIDCCCTTTNFN